MDHTQIILGLLEKQEQSLLSAHSPQSFDPLIFSENDLVERYLNENGLSHDDVDINLLRNTQRDTLDSLVRTAHAQRIKSLRKKWNLNRTLFASLVSVPLRTVENWESGSRLPDAAAQAYIEALEDDLVFERITGVTRK